MSKEMVISATPHETRVAILEEGQLCEIYVEREKEFALVGSIYKGRVTRVLPGMQSAFVEIGLDSDAFLYVTDFLEGIEEYDQVVATVEDKVQKMEDQGGQVFAAPSAGQPAAIEPPDVDAGFPEAPAPAAEPAPRLEAMPSRPPEPRREGRGYDGGRGGRGGRPNRRGGRGGRGGGDRRFGGRDLPSAKYASHRPYEPRTDEPVATDFVPVILPGESLARFKEPPPAGAASPTDELAPQTPPVSASFEASSVAPPESPATSPVEHAPREFAERTQARPFVATHSGGLEPLPGESLSRLQAVETPLPEPVADAPALPVQEAFDAHTGASEYVEEHEDSSSTPEKAETHATHELSADSHTTHELSADEANALAEQVAEAQEEEAEAARQDDHSGFEAPGSQDMDIAPLGEDASEPEDFTEPSATPDASGEMESAEAAVELEESHAEESHEEQAGEGASPAAPAEGAQPWKATVRSDFRARMQHPRRGRGRREERGRRPHQGGGPHRAAPRRPQLISEMLKAGQEIIVQIAKEPLGKKGARITSHIALPGRYLVFMPTLDHTGVSRKIASAEDRARLRHLVTEAKKGASGGFIVRTAAGHASDEEIRTDVEFLMHTWNDIKARSEQRRAPALLHRDLNLVERILRDYLSPDYAAIWVDSEEEFTKVVDFVSRFQPQLVNSVKLYSKETPVFEEFGIQQEIDKGLRPKVWLKSGGYIVINHTEALVAIDVNTGKFVGRGSNRLEDTIVRTNVEASKEIVRQMRLRDLGGIIVIDYIDMEERRNREKVMAALEEALRADRAPSKVLRFNEFGLVAITRKRTKQALERTLCQPCPYCTGSGMVKSVPTLCYEIQVEARKMAPEIEAGSLTLRVHPEIAKALKTRESSLIEELEGWIRKSVIIQADPTLHWEQYDIY